MLPTKAPHALRVIQAFDLISPDGQLHRFPGPTLLQRACMRLRAFAEPAVLSAVILGLIYVARFLGEPLEPLAADACADQIRSRPPFLLWARQFAA